MTLVAAILALAQAQDSGIPPMAPLPIPIVFVSPEFRHDEKISEAIRAEKPVKGWRVVRRGGVVYAVSESLPEVERAREALAVLDALGPSAVSGKPVSTGDLPMEAQRSLAKALRVFMVGSVGNDGRLLGSPAFAITPTLSLTFQGEGRQATSDAHGWVGERTKDSFKDLRAGLAKQPVRRDLRRVEADVARQDPKEGRGVWEVWFDGLGAGSPRSKLARPTAITVSYEVIETIESEVDEAMRERLEAMAATWSDGQKALLLPMGSSLGALPRTIASQIESRLKTDRGPGGMTPEQKEEWIRHTTLTGRRLGFYIWHVNEGQMGMGAIALWP